MIGPAIHCRIAGSALWGRLFADPVLPIVKSMVVTPLRLTVFVDAQPAIRREFADGAVIVGRGHDVGLQIPDRRVSRAHLRLAPSNISPDAWSVTDLASKNGTRVDGRIIDSVEIAEASWLDLGGVPVLAEFAATATDKATHDAATGGVSLLRHRAPNNATENDPKNDPVNDPDDGLASGNEDPISPAAIIRRCVQSVVDLTASERGGLWLARKGGAVPFIQVGTDNPPVSMSVIGDVIKSGTRIIHHDVEGAEALTRRLSIRTGGIRAVTGLPLKDGQRSIGVLYADSSRMGSCYTELDMEILEGLADHASIAARLLAP